VVRTFIYLPIFYIMDGDELAEIAKALDALARRGLLFGGTRLRRRMVVRVRTSPSYIVVKYEDGGVQYVGGRRYFAVLLPRAVPKEVAEALNALAERGMLYARGGRVIAVRLKGRRAEAVLEGGGAVRPRELVVQISSE
jgi:hypothetical protein